MMKSSKYKRSSWYYQGKCHEALGQPAEAEYAYANAERLDAYGEFDGRIAEARDRLSQP